MPMLDSIDYDDVLKAINRCILCLKNGGKVEDVLYAVLNAFNADQAVFLSVNNNSVDLTNSFAICPDSTYLNKYADYYWRYDPLFNRQVSMEPYDPVFKTDDVIPFSQMVKLDYYNSFLKPQNLLGELVIRLCSKEAVFGAICLQRLRNHPRFNIKDTGKATLLVPYLLNIFETAHKISKTNDELSLLEDWMESHVEGIILLDSNYNPLYMNSKANLFCLQMNNQNEKNLKDSGNIHIILPKIFVQECMDLRGAQDYDNSLGKNYTSKIITAENKGRYFIQYFPIDSPLSEPKTPRFIIFIRDISRYTDVPEDFFTQERKLSKREETISQYAAMGFTNKQIANNLNISPFTVQNHLKNIFEKTGLNSRTKLANLIRSNNPPF